MCHPVLFSFLRSRLPHGVGDDAIAANRLRYVSPSRTVATAVTLTLASLLPLASLFAPPPVRAQVTFTWTGASQPTYWTNEGNWSGGNGFVGFKPAPDDNDNVIFDDSFNSYSFLDVSFGVNRITFNDPSTIHGGSEFEIDGNTSASLSIYGGGIRVDAGSAKILTSSLVLSAMQEWNVTSSNSVLTVGANVSGSGNLTKKGAGTLILTGNNSFTASLGLQGGIVSYNSAANLGTGSGELFFDGGGLRYTGITSNFGTNHALTILGTNAASFDVTQATTNLSLDRSIGFVNLFGNNTGSLVKDGAGTLTLTSNSTYNGATTINAGTLLVRGAGVQGRLGTQGINGVVLNGGRFGFATGNNTISRDWALGGGTGSGFAVPSASQVLTLTGALSGNLLTVDGPGTLNLTNTASSFTGNITLIGGSTLIASGGLLPPNPVTSALGNTQADNRTLRLTNGSTFTFGASDVMGNAQSSPKLGLVVEAGATVNNNGAQFNVLGPLTLNGGTLIGTGGAISGAQTYQLTAPVTVGGTTASTIQTTGTNPGVHLRGAISFNVPNVTGNANTDLLVSAPLIDGVGNIAGGLVKTGVGTLTLMGNNTYSGGTTVSTGTLQVGSPQQAGGSLTGGTISVAANATLSFVGSGSAASTNITNNGMLLFGGTGSASSAAIVNNAGGTFDISTATTAVSVGSLAGDGNVALGGQTLVVGALNTNGLLGGVVSGTGGFTKTGNGSLTMTNLGNTFSGNLTVQGGTLRAGSGTSETNPAITVLGDGQATGRVLTVNDGGTFTFGASNVLGNAQSTPKLTLTINAGGTVNNANGRSNTLGAVILNGGTLAGTGGDSALRTYQLTETVTAGGSAPSLISTSGTLGGVQLRGDITFNVANATGDVQADLIVSAPLGNAPSGRGGLIKTGAGTLSLTATNTYTGGTTVNAGTLALQSSASVVGPIVLAGGGTLGAIGNAPVTVTNAVTFNGSGGLTTGALTTGNPSSPGLTLGGVVTLPSDGSVTVTGASRVAITSRLSNTGGEATAFVKRGTGTLVLTNDNSYTGGTLVAGGTLVVNNNFGRRATGSGVGEGAVTVASGATLTGGFQISGPVQINSGGTLGVGNSIGVGQVGSLALAGGSILPFEIGADGVSSDRIDIDTLLSRNGTGLITFALSGERFLDGTTGALSEGTFTLMTFGTVSGVTAGDFFASGVPASWQSAFTLNSPETGGGNNGRGSLTITLRESAVVVPESESVLLFALGGGIMLFASVRRRNLA